MEPFLESNQNLSAWFLLSENQKVCFLNIAELP